MVSLGPDSAHLVADYMDEICELRVWFGHGRWGRCSPREDKHRSIISSQVYETGLDVFDEKWRLPRLVPFNEPLGLVLAVPLAAEPDGVAADDYEMVRGERHVGTVKLLYNVLEMLGVSPKRVNCR